MIEERTSEQRRLGTLRTRLALLISALIGLISLLLIIYLPTKMREAARSSMANTATSLVAMGAHSLSESVASGQPVASAPILNALRESSDLVYIVATNLEGAILASYNETLADATGWKDLSAGEREPSTNRVSSRVVGRLSETGTIFQATAPIRDRGREVGRLYLGFSMDRLDEGVEAGRRAVLISTLLFFLAGVTGARLLAGYLTAPLDRMVRTTREIADGARGVRAPRGGTAETDLLARSFNHMIEKVETTQKELEDLNRYLENRVAERTKQFREEYERRLGAQEALLTSQARYASLVERNLAGVYVSDLSGRIISANSACASMFGYENEADFIARGGTIAYRDPDERREVVERLLSEGALSNLEVELVKEDGSLFWALENVQAVPEEGLIEGVLLDVTERKLSELEIQYRAHHDPLTGLPNRNLLQDRLKMAIAGAERHGMTVAVIFLDIDDLKGINDVLGHPVGDEVLRKVGQRLRGALRATDTVARIGGDEFVILLPDLREEETLHDVAESLRNSLSSSFVIDSEEIFVTASIGAALFPRDGEDAESLMRSADSMMYRVKIGGGDGVLSYSEEEDSRGISRSSLETELEKAIEKGELVPYYQPQYDLATRRMTGVEALVRWNHPEGMLVPPAGFISLAERSGLVVQLGELIMRAACADLKRWQRLRPDLQMAINVSPRQFHQKDFLGVVTRIIEKHGLDPTSIELEITESIAMQKAGWTISLLNDIRETGIRIAVDDFGTGRSSLMYLKRFPIDTVKIDQEFIGGMLSNSHDHSIVNAVLVLSQSLGLRTVAEGIEQEQQYEFLRRSGCLEGQGFLFCPPVKSAEIDEMLAEDESET